MNHDHDDARMDQTKNVLKSGVEAVSNAGFCVEGLSASLRLH